MKARRSNSARELPAQSPSENRSEKGCSATRLRIGLQQASIETTREGLAVFDQERDGSFDQADGLGIE